MSITYHVCKYTPTELLTALGGQCAVLDEAPENFDLSDQVATSRSWCWSTAVKPSAAPTTF